MQRTKTFPKRLTTFVTALVAIAGASTVYAQVSYTNPDRASVPEGRPLTLRIHASPATTVPNVYIADSLNNRIRLVDGALNMTTIAGNGAGVFAGDGGPATSASIKVPYGVAADGAGNTYIADAQNNRVRKVDATGKITTFAGNGSATFSGDGGPATAAGLNNPTGVALDSSGNVYIADQRNNRVRMVDTTGTITTVAGNGTVGYSGDGGAATSAQLYYPTGVAIGVDAGVTLLFIADTNNQVVRIVFFGTILTTAGNGTVGFGCTNGGSALHTPTGVAFDSGNQILYVADYGNNCIRSNNFEGAPLSTVAGTGTVGFGGDGGPATAAALNHPTGVAVDQITHAIYIADYSNHRIREVLGGIIGTVAGTGAAGFNGDGPATTKNLYQPAGVAVIDVSSAGSCSAAAPLSARVRAAC